MEVLAVIYAAVGGAARQRENAHSGPDGVKNIQADTEMRDAVSKTE